MQHTKKKKNMGLGLVIVALFFLFNPNVSIIDIFPDLVGYILMCAGLSQLAMLNDDIADAHLKFKKLIYFEAAKIFSFFILYGVFGESEHAFGSLLFSFCFSIVDVIYAIPAYNCMFNGIEYLAVRRGGEAILHSEKNKSLFYKTKSFTTVFVVAKTACATLPETLSLTTTEFTDDFSMYLYNYINHFRIIGFTIALVFGLVWLARSTKLFKKIIKEREFLDSLSGSFGEILTRDGVFIKKNLKAYFALLVAGALLCIDLHMPDYNIIPDALAAIMFIIGAVLLKKYTTKYNKLLTSSCFYLGASIVASVIKVVFLEEFGFFNAVNYREEAYFMFMGLLASTIVENILFVLTILFLVLLLIEIVDKYTGVEKDETFVNYTIKASIAQKSLYKRLWVSFGLSVLAAACSVAYDFLLIERGYLVDSFWVVDFIVSAAFAGSFILAVWAVLDDVRSKYENS